MRIFLGSLLLESFLGPLSLLNCLSFLFLEADPGCDDVRKGPRHLEVCLLDLMSAEFCSYVIILGT